MSDHKYIVGGDHADWLASGRPVEPGEPLPASAVDPKSDHDRRLIDEGVLIEVTPQKETS